MAAIVIIHRVIIYLGFAMLSMVNFIIIDRSVSFAVIRLNFNTDSLAFSFFTTLTACNCFILLIFYISISIFTRKVIIARCA